MSVTTVSNPSFSYLDGRPKPLHIGAEWVAALSGESFDTVNPATGEVIASVAAAGTADVDRAVAAARRACEGPWSRFSPAQRQNVLLAMADLIDRNAEELRLLEVADMGRPIGAGNSAATVAAILRYYAGWPTKLVGETVPNSAPGSMFTYTLREPVGVVASIVPWNGPLNSAVTNIAPVLATGCTIVLKPAEEASLVPLRLAELLAELDLPPGVVNVVTGVGEVAGAALAAHPDVDKVSFTGSSAVGQEVVRAASGNLKRVSLELGGKSPDVVFADADLDVAVPGAGMGVFRNAGQVCCAGTRVFVERPVYDEFVERLTGFADDLRLGDTLDPDTQIGPVVYRQQLDRVSGYLEAGRAEGARLTAGGARRTDGDLARGYYVAPTVFADVRDDMRIAREGRLGQHLRRLRPGHAVRRHEDERLGQRAEQPFPRRLHGREGGVDPHGRVAGSRAATDGTAEGRR